MLHSNRYFCIHSFTHCLTYSINLLWDMLEPCYVTLVLRKQDALHSLQMLTVLRLVMDCRTTVLCAVLWLLWLMVGTNGETTTSAGSQQSQEVRALRLEEGKKLPRSHSSSESLCSVQTWWRTCAYLQCMTVYFHLQFSDCFSLMLLDNLKPNIC